MNRRKKKGGRKILRTPFQIIFRNIKVTVGIEFAGRCEDCSFDKLTRDYPSRSYSGQNYGDK